MKNILPAFFILLLTGCHISNRNCKFSQLRVTSGSDSANQVLQDTIIFDCFSTSGPDTTGLIKIKGKKSGIIYDRQNGTESSNMLSIRIDDNIFKFRAKAGYVIDAIGKPNTDTMIFAIRQFDNPKNLNTITLIR